MYAQRSLYAWRSNVYGSDRRKTSHNFDHLSVGRSAVFVLRWLVAAVVLLLPVSHLHGAALYSIQDLGDLPGGDDYSVGAAINSFGEVTGLSRVPGGHRAFVWNSTSGMRELENLPGSIGNAINDAGAVVGDHFDTASGRGRAFLWTSAGGVRVLDDIPGTFDSSVALGLNNSGQVVGRVNGTSPTGLGVARAVLWTADGSPIDIGDLPGSADWSVAAAINDHGQVAGYSLSTFGYEAFVWTSETGLQGLGGLTDRFGYIRPYAINSAGHVVGESETPRGRVSFLWSPAGGMVDLGDFPGGQRSSGASDINSHGQIVGHAFAPSGTPHAYLWTSEEGMQDLTTLLDASGAGWNLRFAGEINDAGQIVGSGINPAGITRAFLLTPIPEPATIVLLVCGALGLAGIMRLARYRSLARNG
jgi:probable HAF family extracellular repeat protein